MFSPAELETTICLWSRILVRDGRDRAFSTCGVVFSVQRGEVKASDFIKT